MASISVSQFSFQSTLPRRERRALGALRSLCSTFQSTLPRRERPVSLPIYSIWVDDFNPRSREGSDVHCSAAAEDFSGHFNPRSREGSDFWYSDTQPFSLMISIHAPAKGATKQQGRGMAAAVYFNPRSREGSDEALLAYISRWLAFQSTLPRRERRSHRPTSAATHDFNPRSREGSDPQGVCQGGRDSRFQSTLPRRERQRDSEVRT